MTRLGFLFVLGLSAPGGEDPAKVLEEARTLREQGKYEEALQKHLWFHEHVLEHDPAYVGVRLSFALAGWVELGAKYPKAREAMVSIRDRDTKAVAEGRGTFKLLQDVASLNRYLKEDSKTVDLFLSIEAKQPQLALIGYEVVEPQLVARHEWKTCERYIRDPLKRFERFQAMRQMQLSLATEDSTEPFKDVAEGHFVEQTCRLIEILVGVGRGPDAEKVRDRALAVRDDAAIRGAMDRAMQRKESGPGAGDRTAAQSRPG